jgi:hypothetical protein
MSWPLAGHLVRGELAQFLVHPREQLLDSFRVAMLNGFRNLSDLTHGSPWLRGWPIHLRVRRRVHVDELRPTVRRPSGGNKARLRMNFEACLKLQNVSGNSGYKSKIFILSS